MSDRLSRWSDPIWHREKWRIYFNALWPHGRFTYAYVHDDYDGAEDANDSRCGHGATVEACRADIDERWPA